MVWWRPARNFAAPKRLVLLVFFYNIFIGFLQLFFRLASLRSAKAKAWIAGRKDIFRQLSAVNTKGRPVVWVHSASTGEFEQAKPVIEAIRQTYPHYFIMASFFSPSGYDAAGKYSGIDHRCYLPIDTQRNARRFVAALKPELVIFSKYDFWYHHLRTVHKLGVPLLLISAIFRPGQTFFGWLGGFQRIMLRRFTYIFVQDETSQRLLQQHRIGPCSISGDTRFDRVLAIKQDHTAVHLVERFAASTPVLVAGSTWPGDEALLQHLQHHIKMVIAPHEITPAHIESLQKTFPRSILYSEAVHQEQKVDDAGILIIDNVGMLSRLYQYGAIAYVGGGFTASGIHNTLEAAVWGKPVVFGPTYQKFIEAAGLIAAGGGFSINNETELAQIVNKLLHNKAALGAASHAAAQFVEKNSGATQRIVHYIQENRLLTK